MDLLRQQKALQTVRHNREELEQQVREFEKRFGMKSYEVHDAIRAGKIEETHEVCRWIIYSEILQRDENGQET